MRQKFHIPFRIHPGRKNEEFHPYWIVCKSKFDFLTSHCRQYSAVTYDYACSEERKRHYMANRSTKALLVSLTSLSKACSKFSSIFIISEFVSKSLKWLFTHKRTRRATYKIIISSRCRLNSYNNQQPPKF